MKRLFLLITVLIYYFTGYPQGNFPFIQEEKIWADLTKTYFGTWAVYTTDYYKFEDSTIYQGKYYHYMYKCSHDSTLTNWSMDSYFRFPDVRF